MVVDCLNKEIIERIELIKRGRVPKGYKKQFNYTLPSEWKMVKLYDLIDELESGVSVNSKDGIADEKSFGVLKVGCVHQGRFRPYENKVIKEEEISRAKVNPIKGRVIVNRANTPELVGNVGYIDKNYPRLFLSDKLWQLSFKIPIEGEWLANVLSTRHIKQKLSLLSTGTSNSMRNISKDNFLSIEIALPSVREQKKIIQVLQIWDRAISLKEKLIKEKESQKYTILNSIVRKNNNTKEWSKVKIGNILEIRNLKSKIKDELELYSLTIEDGVTPKSDRYNREFLVKSADKEYKVTKYKDIVYNPANLRFGAICLNTIEKDVLLSPIYETLYLKNEDKYDIEFISIILTSANQIQRFTTRAEGTLVERMAVKVKDFIDFKINVPNNIEEQKEIAKIINIAQKEIELLKQEIIELKKQKQGLMQLLLTGIVRVDQ